MRTKYLCYLPLMLLAVIPRLLWDYYLQQELSTSASVFELSTVQALLMRVSNAFSDWLAFLLIGFAFNKKKEALIAIAVQVFFLLMFAVFKIRLPTFLLYLPITLAAYFVFGFLAFGPKRLWMWTLMLITIYLGRALEMGDELFNQDFNFFISLGYHDFLGGEDFLRPLGYNFKLSAFLDPLIYYVFLAEIALLLAQKSRFSPRVIDLTMQYSRLGAVFLFVFLRLSIYLSILGATANVQEMLDPTRRSSDPWGMLDIQTGNFLHLLSALITLIAVLWYYRRFLMEFLFERGERPSWGYWLLQVPFLEVVIFAFMVIFLKKRDAEDRYQVFLYYNEEGATDVKIIRGLMILIQIVAIGFLTANPGKKEMTNFILIDKLIYSIMVLFYLVSPRVLIGLFAWICANIFFTSIGLINDLEFDARLMSFSILFILIGLLHGSYFSCISPYNEEEPDLHLDLTTS